MKKTATEKHQVVGSVPIRKASKSSLFLRVAGGDGEVNGQRFTFSAGVGMSSIFVDIGGDIYFVQITDLVQEIANLRERSA